MYLFFEEIMIKVNAGTCKDPCFFVNSIIFLHIFTVEFDVKIQAYSNV